LSRVRRNSSSNARLIDHHETDGPSQNNNLKISLDMLASRAMIGVSAGRLGSLLDPPGIRTNERLVVTNSA
jgi:hypothetical protein